METSIKEILSGQEFYGIYVFGSNDPDVLVGECVRQLELPLSDPFKKEEFLVQSRGMGTWLQLKIAEKRVFLLMAVFVFRKRQVG